MKEKKTLDDLMAIINPNHIPDSPRKSGCKGYKYWTDCGYEYDCGYEGHILPCEECKYGGGRKDPEAKCNQDKY